MHATLAQQGTERVFVLRYLAATLDDEKAQQWASEEVVRLDQLAEAEGKLRAELVALSAETRELAALKARGEVDLEEREKELAELKLKLVGMSAQISVSRLRAGVVDAVEIPLEALLYKIVDVRHDIELSHKARDLDNVEMPAQCRDIDDIEAALKSVEDLPRELWSSYWSYYELCRELREMTTDVFRQFRSRNSLGDATRY